MSTMYKPKDITATVMQFTGDNADEIERFSCNAIRPLPKLVDRNWMISRVDDVNVLVEEGDYAVRLFGRTLPVKRSLFELIFEEAE